MESFFVEVLSDRMSVEYLNERLVVGKDARFNVNWEKVLKDSFDIKKKEEFVIVNSIIEFHQLKTQQSGSYITLIGCLSCFEEAIGEMSKIVGVIEKQIDTKPVLFIAGEIYPYNSKEFEVIVKDNYFEKKNKFDKMFGDNIRTCPYDYYNKMNKFKRIISKLRNNRTKKDKMT